jgi:hypothetical protein
MLLDLDHRRSLFERTAGSLFERILSNGAGIFEQRWRWKSLVWQSFLKSKLRREAGSMLERSSNALRTGLEVEVS